MHCPRWSTVAQCCVTTALGLKAACCTFKQKCAGAAWNSWCVALKPLTQHCRSQHIVISRTVCLAASVAKLTPWMAAVPILTTKTRRRCFVVMQPHPVTSQCPIQDPSRHRKLGWAARTVDLPALCCRLNLQVALGPVMTVMM